MSDDESEPERFCEEFRSGVNSSCAPNLNWGAAELESGKRDRKLEPKQLWEEFRAGVNGGCASNLNPCAASSSQPKWVNLVCVTLGVGSLECELQVSVEGMATGARKPLLVSMSVLLSATAGKLKMVPSATYEVDTVTPNWKPGDGEWAPNLNSGGKVWEGD